METRGCHGRKLRTHASSAKALGSRGYSSSQEHRDNETNGVARRGGLIRPRRRPRQVCLFHKDYLSKCQTGRLPVSIYYLAYDCHPSSVLFTRLACLTSLDGVRFLQKIWQLALLRLQLRVTADVFLTDEDVWDGALGGNFFEGILNRGAVGWKEVSICVV